MTLRFKAWAFLLAAVSGHFPLIADKPPVDGSYPECIQSLLDGYWKAEQDILLSRNFKQEVNQLLEKGEHKRLEALAKRLRASPIRFTNGDRALYHFYAALSSVGDGRLEDEKRDELWGPKTLLLKKWLKKKTDGTAELAMAIHHNRLAQHSRSGRPAHKVTEEGWKGLEDHTALSQKYVEMAKKKIPNDPQVYDCLATQGIFKGLSLEEMEKLASKTHSIDPSYPYTDNKMAFYLLPRWRGKPGDMEAWAKKVAGREDGLGAEAYARIASSISYDHGMDLFEETGLQWEMVEAGFAEMEKRHPHSQCNLSRWTLFLCMRKEKERAKENFLKLGGQYDPEVWGKEIRFRKSEWWASRP